MYVTHGSESTVRAIAGRREPAIHNVRNRQRHRKNVAITSCFALIAPVYYQNIGRMPSIFRHLPLKSSPFALGFGLERDAPRASPLAI